MTTYKERPWAMFHGGRWKQEPPTTPGHYYVADRLGAVRGIRVWEHNAFGVLVEVGRAPGERWQGWIWSCALPDAPNIPVPEWGE